MLVTLQMLQRELTGGLKETQVLGSSNVAVLIPNAPSVKYSSITETPLKDDDKVYFELSEAEGSEEEIAELLLQNEKMQSAAKEKVEGQKPKNDLKKDSRQAEMFFRDDESAAINDVPTFAQYRKVETEMPKVIEQTREKEQAFKHLKKGISELDKQLFLKELFRGDGDMYERSIKTIDNFHAYPEAEYWILRELKTKLGWMPDNPTVDHFDRLVKRRFA